MLFPIFVIFHSWLPTYHCNAFQFNCTLPEKHFLLNTLPDKNWGHKTKRVIKNISYLFIPFVHITVI